MKIDTDFIIYIEYIDPLLPGVTRSSDIYYGS